MVHLQLLWIILKKEDYSAGGKVKIGNCSRYMSPAPRQLKLIKLMSGLISVQLLLSNPLGLITIIADPQSKH